MLMWITIYCLLVVNLLQPLFSIDQKQHPYSWEFTIGLFTHNGPFFFKIFAKKLEKSRHHPIYLTNHFGQLFLNDLKLPYSGLFLVVILWINALQIHSEFL